MLVETFECQETASEPIEASEEAIRLINEMGLEGQQSLIHGDESSQRDTRMPYREITDLERFVYKTLCPVSYEIAAYKRTPIPLRVLQIAAHAKDTGCFDKLVVWDAAAEADKDPVLVGIKKGEGEQAWRTTTFILARWGDVLDEWPILCKRALERHREKVRAKLLEIKHKVDARLAGVDHESLDYYAGDGNDFQMPTYY